jgi:hypothetical protein
MIFSMYFMLTTLSTVGYGDSHPHSIMEKAVCAGLQVLGVTIFSIVMNAFIKIVMTMIDITAKSQEDDLIAWFNLIKKIKNQM